MTADGSNAGAQESAPSAYGSRSLLRFTTVGSVDDGKSTLIGRLLHDTRSVHEDQLAAVRAASGAHGPIDLALLTDGLRAEREQGITIDVAYRYFSTERRNFIIADTPGHEQYTRNMATGASTANLAIILIDARQGVVTQTRRHSFIASLLGIPRLLIAVNKMDLVDWSQSRYEEIRESFQNFAVKLGIVDLKFVPVSALVGDNVVRASKNMPWYRGEPILEHLETVYIGSDRNLVDFRFPVQCVLRPDSDFRGFAGQVASGRIRPGEELLVLPSRRRVKLERVLLGERELEEAFPSQSVTLVLSDEVDVSRGDMLVRVNNVPAVERDFEAMIVWFSDQPLDLEKTLRVLHTTRETRVQVSELVYRVDVNTLSRETSGTLELNEIGRVALRAHEPLFFDPYRLNRSTGSFILVDPDDNATVAAGMIIQRRSQETLHQIGDEREQDADSERHAARHVHRHRGMVTSDERQENLGQNGVVVWLTGLSGSGKSTIAVALERALFDRGRAVVHLDGDNLRTGLNQDLGFSRYDRRENIRRVSEVARLFAEQGTIVITALISPYAEERSKAREIIGAERFQEVFVQAPLEVCEQRDPKGLYARARKGEIEKFTGVDDRYDVPAAPQLVLDTTTLDVDGCVERLLAYLS